jgi:hypothetical protein
LFSGVVAAATALIRQGPAAANKDATHQRSPTLSITTSWLMQGMRECYEDDDYAIDGQRWQLDRLLVYQLLTGRPTQANSSNTQLPLWDGMINYLQAKTH